MLIHLIALSYSCLGEYGSGSWRGPERYLQAGAERLLRERDFSVVVEHIQPPELHGDVLQASVISNRELARAVERAREAGAFPLVLSGTCDSSLGVISGLKRSHPGIIWCDAHGDFNTPAISSSGFFVGMPLALATGHCYQDLWEQLGNDEPIAHSRVLLVDARELDPLEQESIESAAIPVVKVNALQQSGDTIVDLAQYAARVPDVYLHLDIDIVDSQEAPGVDFRTPGGPSVQQVEQALETLGKHFHFQAALMTSYNPDLDQDDKALHAGLRLMVQIAESARAGRIEHA